MLKIFQQYSRSDDMRLTVKEAKKNCRALACGLHNISEVTGVTSMEILSNRKVNKLLDGHRVISYLNASVISNTCFSLLTNPVTSIGWRKK